MPILSRDHLSKAGDPFSRNMERWLLWAERVSTGTRGPDVAQVGRQYGVGTRHVLFFFF